MTGQDVFVLYDTFGFPVDLTEDIARKAGFGIDTEGFEAHMELQRKRPGVRLHSALLPPGRDPGDPQRPMSGLWVTIPRRPTRMSSR